MEEVKLYPNCRPRDFAVGYLIVIHPINYDSIEHGPTPSVSSKIAKPQKHPPSTRSVVLWSNLTFRPANFVYLPARSIIQSVLVPSQYCPTTIESSRST